MSFQKASWVKIKLTRNAEEVHLNVQNSVHKYAEDLNMESGNWAPD